MKKALTRNHFLFSALLSGISSLALLVIYSMGLASSEDERRHVESEIQSQEARHIQLRLAGTPAFQESLKAQVAGQQKLYHDFVKDSQESSDLNFAINRIAQNHHLKGFSGKVLETTRTEKQTSARKIREPRLQLNFTSDFANFIRFVNALERHRPAFFINTFKVERIAKDQTEIKAELEIAAFVHADTAPSPRPSGAQESGERIQ